MQRSAFQCYFSDMAWIISSETRYSSGNRQKNKKQSVNELGRKRQNVCRSRWRENNGNRYVHSALCMSEIVKNKNEFTMFKKRKGGGKIQYLNVCATNTPGLLAALQNLMKSFHPLLSMYFLFMPFKTTSLKILDYQSSHFYYELYHLEDRRLSEIL